jgi:hypothetical protein
VPLQGVEKIAMARHAWRVSILRLQYLREFLPIMGSRKAVDAQNDSAYAFYRSL